MMATVGITLPSDPQSLMEYLDPILGQTGCLKSSLEVQKFVSLMKEAQLLTSRCIVLNVVKATKTQSTLERFMDAGGWTILNLWLAEAKKNQISPFIVEILQVLQQLPVTIAALKQGNMGKLIKQLSKQEHPEVKRFAGDLLSKWMAIFREGQATKAKGDRPSSTSSDDPGGKQSPAKPDKPDKPDKPEKKERSGRKESKKDKSKTAVPPVEASQPPPGPLVPLGRPKERVLKRPRDLLLQKGQLPPEKKVKSSPSSGADEKTAKGKGPVESEGFMNALSSQAAKMKERKIKKTNKANAKSSSSTSSSKSASTSEGGEGGPAEGGGEEQNQDETTANSEGPDVAYRKKKRVSWAEEDNLVMVHYFELDESERANVSGKSFLVAAQQEKMKEREALESGLMFSRDRLIEMIPWQRPLRVEGVLILVERGLDSEQKRVQAEREGKVLAQLFLSKSSLPPSASEPDPEPPDVMEGQTKFIPLMEPNAPDMPPHPVFTSPTHVAPPGQLLPDSPLPSPATTIHQAQSLINYYSENNNAGLPPQGGPPMMDMQYQGGREGGRNMPPGDYFNYQQGFPPGNSWGGPPGPGYYGDQFYHGRGRGRGMGFRGRGGGGGGGGRFFGKRAPYPDSRICKHFITHGCKLGSQCRFLHCTPEELASQMAHEQQQGQGPPRRPNGGPPPPHHREPQSAEHMDTSGSTLVSNEPQT